LAGLSNLGTWNAQKTLHLNLVAGDEIEIFGTNGGGAAGIQATIEYVNRRGQLKTISTSTTGKWTCGGVKPVARPDGHGAAPWGGDAVWIWNSSKSVAGDHTSCKIRLPGHCCLKH